MNKAFLFIFILLSSVLISFSQEVQFSTAVIPSGGGSSSSHAVNLSRWRIGQINVITLPSDEDAKKVATVPQTTLPDNLSSDWNVTLFPNPVQSKLHVRFDMDKEGEYAFEIFDVTGRIMMTGKAGIIVPGQTVELDLSQLAPALYLFKITPSEAISYKQFKITRQ